MLLNLRRLILGLVLIAAAAALLLFSDLGSRIQPDDAQSPAEKTVRLAILQHVSQTVLDQGREGIMAGLAERGWVAGRNLDVKLYNAEGDLTVGQAIAKEMISGGNDMLLTISTVSLQAVANANRKSQIDHVFGLVTDPVAAGVGISPDDPLVHPAWMAGYGTMQPVAKSFRIAREMNPELKTVGVVWNAAEANSESQILLARKVCEDLGITLLEATVDNSAGVGESAAALTSRGAEALWVNGDVTVITAIDSVIAAANKADIPVFTVVPPNVKRGALFDLGADYREVGRLAGALAGDILNGREPATVPIENALPEIQTINLQALKDLKGPWTIPESIQKSARIIITESGVEQTRNTAPPEPLPAPPAVAGQTYRIGLASFAPEPSRASCEKGLLDGMQELGFVEGKNLIVTRNNAQGEMVNIVPVIQNFASSPNNVIVTFSTPVLQAALTNAGQKPVVFTYVTDPIAAGDGTSFTDHEPNVTGVGSLPPVAEAIRLARRILPEMKTIGCVYNNGEANSVKVVSLLRKACLDQGLKLIEMPAANTGEVMQSTQALVSRQVDAIFLGSDNTAMQAVDGIVSTATAAGIPIINDDPTFTDRGMLLTVGPGFYHSGKAAAPLLARVLGGEDPANIPFQNVSVNSVRFNSAVAKKLGLKISEEVIQEITATKTTKAPAAATPKPPTKKWNIGVVLYNETPPSEEVLAGMAAAWKESPLVEGRDYTLSVRSAQGDMPAISGCLDSAMTEGADLIVPLSTPTLQTTIARVRKLPVVFSLVANPVAAGAGTSFTNHLPNVTGVAVMAPIKEILDLVQKYYPTYRRFGSLFCPAEVNSVDLKDALEAECKARGLTLETVGVNSAGEMADSALALMSRPIDAVLQISDNLSSSGFTAITKAARRAQKPLISMNSTMIPHGAGVAVGRDYHEAGVQTTHRIERVIGGEDPANIPFILPPIVVLSVSPVNAEAVGMPLPDGLIKEANHVIE